jgi:hypothetical protein
LLDGSAPSANEHANPVPGGDQESYYEAHHAEHGKYEKIQQQWLGSIDAIKSHYHRHR